MKFKYFKIKNIIYIFLIIIPTITYSSAYNIITKINEITFVNDKNVEINKVLEKVNKNKDGNKNGKLYIELADGSVVKGKYDNGYLQGKLTITNKKDNEHQEFNYKDNLKNGKYIYKSDNNIIKLNFINNISNGEYYYKDKNEEVISKHVDGKIQGKV
ncbi:hypothetical protein, partial [Oceanivirga salmonicida]